MRNPPKSVNTTLLAAALSLTLAACGETGIASAQAGGNALNPANDSATTIASGAEFNSSSAGVSIRMPAGITGMFDAVSGTLVFNNAQNTLGGFILGGSAGAGQAGASRALRTLLPQLGIEIAQVFVDDVNPDGSTSAQFGATNSAGLQVFMQLDVLQGASGNYVAVLANSTFNDQSELNAIVAEMSRSVVFTTPPPSTSVINLGGIVLEASSSSTDFNGSGAATGGDESFLVTCVDGRYRFSATSSFFLSFDNGAGGSTTDSVEHEGQFISHVDLAGNQLVSLHSADQGTFVFNVTLSNGSLFLDQTAYQQTGTSEQQCS